MEVEQFEYSSHSTDTGRQILLKQDARERVHQLAKAYDLACTQRREPDLATATKPEPTIRK